MNQFTSSAFYLTQPINKRKKEKTYMKRKRSSLRRAKRTVVAFACNCKPSTPDDCVVICISGTADLNTGAAMAVYDLNQCYYWGI